MGLVVTKTRSDQNQHQQDLSIKRQHRKRQKNFITKSDLTIIRKIWFQQFHDQNEFSMEIMIR
jgi:hypothetical protein